MLTSLKNSIANYFKPPRPPKRQTTGTFVVIRAVSNKSRADSSNESTTATTRATTTRGNKETNKKYVVVVVSAVLFVLFNLLIDLHCIYFGRSVRQSFNSPCVPLPVSCGCPIVWYMHRQPSADHQRRTIIVIGIRLAMIDSAPTPRHPRGGRICCADDTTHSYIGRGIPKSK